MVNTRHSHCFSNSQLQIIIDSYLNMAPYSSALVQVIKNYTKTYQQQLEMHRRDKPHPIKIYTKDSYNNKNILEEQKQCSNDNHRELRATYASNTLRYYYLYPLECVIQMLLSEQFYSFLPQNIIVNGLQTQTNLRIIIQTLKIVSEDMGKRIRSTISGKQLEKIEEDDKILENDTQKQLTQPLKADKVQTSGFFSIVNIQVEEEDQVVLLKPPLLLKNEQKLVRTNIAGTQRQINIDRDVAESDCHFCQGYLIYLYETIGQKPLDEDINRISMQSVRCLRLIAKAVNYFTMYLEQTGQTKILNDIHIINKILNTMGLVITEDIYSSQLNPKNKQPPPLIRRTPKNLIEDLQPYFTNEISNKDWEKYYSVDQLFRMIIYCPTTQEVKQQLKQSKIDHFQKDPVLKSYEKEDIVKKLLKKECEEMKQFEMERIMIAENTVNLKPVYKQLQFPEELQSPQNLQPTHHNGHNSSRHNTSKPLNKQKSFPFSINIKTHKIQSKSPIASKKQSKIFMAQMGSCISSSKIQKKGSTQLNKRNRQNYKQLNTIDASLQNSNISTITKALKLNMLKETSTAPKLITTSTEVYDILTDKNHSQMKEIKEVKPAKNEGQENGLTNQQFRRILIHAYNRSQTLHRGDSSYTQQYTHNSSINNYLSTSSIKMGSKKNNGYNTSLSNYIGRKQQQEQVESIEKQEKELYNKQQLNGFHVKSQIQEEIRSGKAIVIDDYKGVRVTKQFQVPDFYRKMNKHDTKYTKYTKYTQYTTARNKLQKQGKTKQNVIQETSTKYNQTGLIRNQKYNKCIKNELINHRQSFLLANQKQNEAKNRLFLTCLKKKVTETDFVPDVKRMYELELQAIKEQRQIQNNFLPQSKAKIQQYF